MLALSSPALALGVGCALAFSASDYFRKAVPASCSTPLVLFYIVGLQMPVSALWIVVSGDVNLSDDYWFPGLVDAVAGLAANLLFIAALRRSPMSLMVPLLGIVPAFTVVFAGALLGEWPNLGQDFGILLVVAGLFIIFVPVGSSANPVAVWRNLIREPGTLPMAGVIVLWSATPALDKLCMERASVGVHGLLQLALLWAALLVWVVGRSGPRGLLAPRIALRPLLGAGITSAAGYLLQLAAYKLALVAVIELLKRVIGMVGSVVFGRALFKEPLTIAKVVGISVIAIGLPLVLMS
jgi:drug/metabolite transporter (DMT)-like permease